MQVRKRAAGGLVEVLASLQAHGAVLHAASDALAKLSTGILARPEVSGVHGHLDGA